ncbi:MAG: alpha/beta fold hydrolase [Candidatus Kerfeldbacteria bacterium]|nr:alpha/beta fold hydrolase [Candidatus Kerfeldbacteria bacterium]
MTGERPAVLLIHGFCSHRSSLEPLIPELERRGLEWHLPILAGHGTRPEDLRNKRWSDWRRDVDQAYRRLRQNHDQVVVIALSMGTLLAIELAAEHPAHVSGLVLISPAVKFTDPLAIFTPLVVPFMRRYPFPPQKKFSFQKFAQRDRGYPWFPTAAYYSYWQRTRTILDVVKNIRCPVRIIQSRNDHVAQPRGAQKIYDLLRTPKEILWHERSGHEMLLDVEADTVVKEIMGFQPLSRQP